MQYGVVQLNMVLTNTNNILVQHTTLHLVSDIVYLIRSLISQGLRLCFHMYHFTYSLKIIPSWVQRVFQRWGTSQGIRVVRFRECQNIRISHCSCCICCMFLLYLIFLSILCDYYISCRILMNSNMFVRIIQYWILLHVTVLYNTMQYVLFNCITSLYIQKYMLAGISANVLTGEWVFKMLTYLE